MFGSFVQSFKNKIVFGSPSAGDSGSGTTDGYYNLGTIDLSDDYGNEGSDGVSSPEPELAVEVVDVKYVETMIISDSGIAGVSGPITLVIAEEHIVEHSDVLEASYNAQQDILQSLNIDLSGFSVEQIKSTIYYLKQATNPSGSSSWFHFAVAEGFEAYSGFSSDLAAVVNITDAHLEAMALVEQGYSIAEAQMIENGTTMDEAVFTDAAGNYIEADAINTGDVLFSSGIEVTGGLMIIEPNTDRLPSFAIPVQAGMEEYDTDSWFYHDYDASVGVPINGYDALRFSDDGLDALEAALIANPTPGDDSPASIDGTLNDVGNLTPGDGDDNFVFTFVVDNHDPNQSDIVVNYTIDDQHMLAQGYVARMVQRYDNTPGDLTDEDYSYSLVTFGEGDAAIQGIIEGPASLYALSAWYTNSYEIFDTANEALL